MNVVGVSEGKRASLASMLAVKNLTKTSILSNRVVRAVNAGLPDIRAVLRI